MKKIWIELNMEIKWEKVKNKRRCRMGRKGKLKEDMMKMMRKRKQMLDTN